MQVSDGESATFPLGVHHYFGHAGENLFTADNVYSDGEEDSYGVLVEKL
jgi:mannose-6-phosphate isomerase-like protein (cupin superfamily)